MSSVAVMKCGKCCMPVTDQNRLQCDSFCKQWYHKVCTGLPDDRFNLFIANRRRKWKCEWCLKCIDLNKVENNLPFAHEEAALHARRM